MCHLHGAVQLSSSPSPPVPTTDNHLPSPQPDGWMKAVTHYCDNARSKRHLLFRTNKHQWLLAIFFAIFARFVKSTVCCPLQPPSHPTLDISIVISRYYDTAAFCFCAYGAVAATLTLSPLTVSIFNLKLTVVQ